MRGAAKALDRSHPRVLDPNLLTQELDLLPEPLLFSLLSQLGVHALCSPALGQCQGGSGKGDDLDDRRTDATRPSAGQGRRTELRGTEHGQPPEPIKG